MIETLDDGAHPVESELRSCLVEARERLWPGADLYCLIQNGDSALDEETTRRVWEKLEPAVVGEKRRSLILVLHSWGGSPAAAFQIARLLTQHYDLQVVVPQKAKSAATLLSLAASSIWMGQLGELGPLDTQVFHGLDGHLPAADDVVGMQRIWDYFVDFSNRTMLCLHQNHLPSHQAHQLSYDFTAKVLGGMMANVDPFRLGAKWRAQGVTAGYALRLLRPNQSQEVAEEIVDRLAWAYPSHDFVIDVEECRSLRLPVKVLDADLDRKLSNILIRMEKERISYNDFVKQATISPKTSAARAGS